MRRILVPVDGSENCDRALQHAAKLAGVIQPLTVHLLHVAETISYGDRSHAFYSNEALERPALSRGEEIVKAAAAQLSSTGAEVLPQVAIGEAASTIVERAEELECDAIVMGMRGNSLLSEILMGSTVTSVLSRSRIPVTLVK
jgi:nucleotide-binding universal stress UspA family protein